MNWISSGEKRIPGWTAKTRCVMTIENDTITSKTIHVRSSNFILIELILCMNSPVIPAPIINNNDDNIWFFRSLMRLDKLVVHAYKNETAHDMADRDHHDHD